MKGKKDNSTFPRHSSLTQTILLKRTSCPPETSLSALTVQLAHLCSLNHCSLRAWWGGLLLHSCWCTRNTPLASPGGNTRCCAQASLPRNLQSFQGVLSHSVGFGLHQHIIWVGPVHDGIMLHNAVHSH